MTGMMVRILFHGRVKVGQGLGFHSLGSVHQQQNPFARSQGPGYFIGKIHMARGIDQVELKFLSPFGWYRAG